ncbi:MAG: nitrous oxide reductase family maturation protein NosD [Promethearchaeota archaeon]
MRKKACILSIVLIFWLIVISVSGTLVFGDDEARFFRNSDNLILGQTHTDHIRIVIDNDADFANQGWPGSGDVENPYIIDSLRIDYGQEPCISISDTTLFFEIKNCRFERDPYGPADTGILFDNVINGKVRHCYFEHRDRAIKILDSRNCFVLENTILSSWGIMLSNSHNCSLVENSVTQNTYAHAIQLTDSYNCTLDFNTVQSNSQAGFEISNSTNTNLTRNSALDNTYTGFYIVDSTNCMLYLNSAINNGNSGFTISRSSNCTIWNNTANLNSFDGIGLPSSKNCTLIYNNVSNNACFGIKLGYDSEYNRVYLNRIDMNDEGTAEDDGESNYWDDGISRGNYWRDYDGHSNYYYIPGYGHGIDHYPFLWDSVTITSDTTNNSILTGVIILSAGVGISAIIVVVILVLRKRAAPREG